MTCEVEFWLWFTLWLSLIRHRSPLELRKIQMRRPLGSWNNPHATPQDRSNKRSEKDPADIDCTDIYQIAKGGYWVNVQAISLVA